MNAREHLAALVDGLPDGATLTVRADWVRELLSDTERPERAPVALSLDLTVDEVASALHRSPQRVRDWIREGRFPGAWHMGREWRIPRGDVEAIGCGQPTAEAAA